MNKIDGQIAACSDRHGAHRTALVVVRIAVGLTEAAARRTRHTAGVFRHAALAVIGIVGNDSDRIVYERVRSAGTVQTVVFVAVFRAIGNIFDLAQIAVAII